MTPSRPTLTLALLLAAATLHAQHLPDPANLTGEQVAPQSPADTLPINHGVPALQQLLLKLRTRASLMLIVAHPDDEDGGLLTFESRGAGARVAMLTLTRGEGGQNLVSADFDDALGLIRTQELLAAGRYMGIDQFFGSEADFGFSKTKEESLEKWTHDRVLYDAVRAVRLYRPLVLASVFVGGPTDGHGHHQVAGEISQEVFLAAGDPSVFPEMGLPPWSPLKVYARVPFSRVTADGMFDYATGKTIPPRFQNYVTGQVFTTPPSATVQIHEGDPAMALGKPALGMDGLTYVQFARKGLALQKTQIGANSRLAPAGRSDTGYTLIAARLGCPMSEQVEAEKFPGVKPCPPRPLPDTEQSLFDGIDTSLPSLAELIPREIGGVRSSLRQDFIDIDKQLAEAQRLFDPAHPELVAPPLRTALKAVDILIAGIQRAIPNPAASYDFLHELRIKRVELNNALILAHSLTLRAELTGPAEPILTTDRQKTIQIQLSNLGGSPLELISITPVFTPKPSLLQASTPRQTGKVASGESPTLTSTLAFPTGLPATRPYFSRPSIEQPFYNIADPNLRNAPATPAPLVVEAVVRDQGVDLHLVSQVQYPAGPDREQTVAIVPPISVSVTPSAGIIRSGEKGISIATLVRATGGSVVETTLRAPPGWLVIASGRNSLAQQFAIQPGKLIPGQAYTLTAIATAAHHDYTDSFRAVGYPGLPSTNLYTPATYRATAVAVTTAPGLHIAYLPGTGDPLPDFLPNLGVTPALLTPTDLTPANLKQFDAVILGVRAYAAQSALTGPGSKPLLDYAAAGGVVILQYMTARYGDAEAPFPIQVPGDPSHNVVVEAEPVQVLAPDAPILNWPNKITSADFNAWVAERGHGFAASWAPQYQPLLETHDPGQDPQRGGLLLAPVGKGAYIYCALALYRQLPEGVPGAYRLLANLISYSKNPNR